MNLIRLSIKDNNGKCLGYSETELSTQKLNSLYHGYKTDASGVIETLIGDAISDAKEEGEDPECARYYEFSYSKPRRCESIVCVSSDIIENALEDNRPGGRVGLIEYIVAKQLSKEHLKNISKQ